MIRKTHQKRSLSDLKEQMGQSPALTDPSEPPADIIQAKYSLAASKWLPERDALERRQIWPAGEGQRSYMLNRLIPFPKKTKCRVNLFARRLYKEFDILRIPVVIKFLPTFAGGHVWLKHAAHGENLHPFEWEYLRYIVAKTAYSMGVKLVQVGSKGVFRVTDWAYFRDGATCQCECCADDLDEHNEKARLREIERQREKKGLTKRQS